jgi:hypothetical protein
MTRMIRLRFRRLVLVAATTTGAVALAAGLATSASAGVDPSPTPTPVVTESSPPPSPTPLFRLRLRPEAFIVHADTSTLPGGTVFATGRVRGSGTDPAWLPGSTADTFALSGPVGTVNVLHSRIGDPVVDFGNCTAELDQTGRWVFLGGTGADARAFGFGSFRLREVVIYQRGLFGRCLLRAAPLWRDVQVLGVGRATLLRLHVFAPRFGPALLPVS